MPALLVFPGQRTVDVDLVEMLREAHDASAQARLAELVRRKKAGIPLDDETRWPMVEAHATELLGAVAARQSARVAELALDLQRATDGHALTEPAPFVAPDGIGGVRVILEVISQADRLRLNAELADAWAAFARVIDGDSEVARREADERVVQAQLALVRRVVVDVRGVHDENGLPHNVDSRNFWEAIRLAGLLGPLFVAARHFLALPPGKALRCGLPSSSTSPSGTAAGAQPHSASNVAATGTGG